MIKIFASHPAYKQVIFLPSPEFGDITRLNSTVQLKRSMNNATIVTHIVKRPNSRAFELNFNLNRLKSLEFLEFYKRHGAELMKLVRRVDFLPTGTIEELIGYLKVNPLELEKVERELVSESKEKVSLRVDFETIVT